MVFEKIPTDPLMGKLPECEGEREAIARVLSEYLKDSRVHEMTRYIQHGSVTTYEHCLRVTRLAYRLNQKYRLGADERVLLTGAFLHDFFLYDWHDPTARDNHWHGFRHPAIACRNAKAHFDVDRKVQKVIRSHMWPLTPLSLPTSKEAAIVCVADKIASAYETVRCRRAPAVVVRKPSVVMSGAYTKHSK